MMTSLFLTLVCIAPVVNSHLHLDWSGRDDVVIPHLDLYWSGQDDVVISHLDLDSSGRDDVVSVADSVADYALPCLPYCND